VLVKVYLWSAGPGGGINDAPEDLLEYANVVVCDALVNPLILMMINPPSRKIHAGKASGASPLVQDELPNC